MSRQCETCNSEKRAEIEHLQSMGVGPRELARRYPSLTKDTLSRHFAGNHHIERAPTTETTDIYEELAGVLRDLHRISDPARTENIVEREAAASKRGVLTARRERLERLLYKRLQTLQERRPELEARRDLLRFSRSDDAELESAERELAEAESAMRYVEEAERGRKLYETELAGKAEANRNAEDRRCLQQSREAHKAVCRKLEESWAAFGPLLREWCASIEQLDRAASRVGEGHKPINAERFGFVNWLTGGLTTVLDTPTVRMAGIRTPRPGHTRAFLVEPEADVTEPKNQMANGGGTTTSGATPATVGKGGTK